MKEIKQKEKEIKDTIVDAFEEAKKYYEEFYKSSDSEEIIRKPSEKEIQEKIEQRKKFEEWIKQRKLEKEENEKSEETVPFRLNKNDDEVEFELFPENIVFKEGDLYLFHECFVRDEHGKRLDFKENLMKKILKEYYGVDDVKIMKSCKNENEVEVGSSSEEVVNMKKK